MKAASLRATGSLAMVAISLLLGGCQDTPTAEATDDSRLDLRVSVASLPDGPLNSTAAALEKVEDLQVVVTRTADGTVLFSAVLPMDDGLEEEPSVTFPLAEGAVDVEVEVGLLAGGDALFEGATQAVLAPGESEPVEVELAPVPAGVQVSPVDLISEVEQTVQLEGTVVFVTGDAIDDLEPTWSTLDPDVVSVTPEGLLTALARGEAEVVAEYPPFSETLMVQVGRPVAMVRVSPEAAEVVVGERQAFTATAEDADGEVVTGVGVGWSSSNPEVAVVDSSGVATGVEVGTVTIQATVEGVQGSAVLTVEQSDLAVSGPLELPERSVQGDEVEVSGWVVENHGTATGPFTIGFYLSEDEEIGDGDTRLDGQVLEAGLEADEVLEGSATVEIPAGLSCGSYFIGVVVDEADDVDEGDETNNVVTGPTEIAGCGAPVITDLRPSLSLASSDQYIFRGSGAGASRSITFTVDDPDQNVTSVQAVAIDSDFIENVLPVSQSGDRYTVDPSGGGLMSDGPYTVTITVTDDLGQSDEVELAYDLDTSPPSFFDVSPPPSQVDGFSTASLTFSGTIFDSSPYRSVVARIYEDSDGVCSTTFDQRLLVVPDEVDQQAIDLTDAVEETNNFESGFTLFVQEPGTTVTYCTVITAEDAARDNRGLPDPNRSVFRSPTLVEWLATESTSPSP